MFNFFSKLNKKNKFSNKSVKEDVLANLEKLLQANTVALEKLYNWLEKNTDFEREMIDDNDEEMRIKGCIGYLKIALISGEIDSNKYKELVDNLEKE